MNAIGVVVVSTVSAAVVSLAVASLSATGSRPAPFAADGDTRWLAHRLERLERALDALPQEGVERPALGAAIPATDARIPIAAPSNASVAGLASRVELLERRIEVLGRDPLLRARSYLTSESPRARREAVELLARFAPFDPKARDAIRSMLDDPDADVRGEAVEAIAETGDLDALPKVRARLADEDPGVRRDAAQALEELLPGLPPNSPEFRAGLDALTARMTDPDSRVREVVVETVSELGPELAGPMLVRLLDDPEPDVRDEAIDALGQSGHAAAIPHLQRLYDSGPADNRLSVAIAMARLGDSSAFSKEAVALVESAGNLQIGERERARAVAILGNVDPARYQAVLTRALEDPSDRVRRAAERALRRRGR